MTDKDETLAEITSLRIKLDAVMARHEAEMHEIALALVALENSLLPTYSADEEAAIMDDHINQMM